jgi:hypothetical protein
MYIIFLFSEKAPRFYSFEVKILRLGVGDGSEGFNIPHINNMGIVSLNIVIEENL